MDMMNATITPTPPAIPISTMAGTDAKPKPAAAVVVTDVENTGGPVIATASTIASSLQCPSVVGLVNGEHMNGVSNAHAE